METCVIYERFRVGVEKTEKREEEEGKGVKSIINMKFSLRAAIAGCKYRN